MPKPSGIPLAATLSDSDSAKALEDRLEELKNAVDCDDFGKAVQVCEALLADGTIACDNDNRILVAVVTQVYLKALLHQSKFEQVLAKSSNLNVNESSTKVLQAYAYYRLEQYDQALHTAQQCTATSGDATDDDGAASLIEAQALFHENQTEKALHLFQQQLLLLSSADTTSATITDDHAELYTNILAVLTANATPFVDQQSTTVNDITKKAYALLDSSPSNNNDNDDYPYDLAYNLATHALLTADTAAKRHQALALLRQAQKQCQAIHSASSHQQQLPKELYPLQLQAIWGNTLWGEPASTSTTISSSNTSTGKKNKPHGNTAKVNALLDETINPNLLSLHHHQNSNPKTLAKLRQALENLLDGNATWKLSPLQTRLSYYNLALVLLQQQEYPQAREVLQALLQTLGTGASNNSSSKKKKKNTATNNNSSSKVIPTWTEQDMLWWQVRIEVLMAYTYYWQQQQQQAPSDAQDDNATTPQQNSSVDKEFQDAIDKVQRRSQKLQDDVNDTTTASGSTRTKLLVYLELHLKELQSAGNATFQKDPEQQFQWLLQQMQQKKQPPPAMIATLAKTYQDRNQPEKAKELLLSIGSSNDIDNKSSGNQIVAEMAMAQEQYAEAVKLYEQILLTDPDDSLAVRARFVEALSHLDPQRAIQEWKKVSEELDDSHDDDDDEEEDGQELELRELPRIKHHGDAANATTSAGMPHAGDSTSNATTKNGKPQRKSQEAILRRRAKKREEYLQGLQEKGLYNPAKPTRPDPERWIPKHERQRNRRRNRNNQQHKGAQGGISNKDAAKLDVAARANASATNTASSGPSTAHLTVAGNSRKGGGRRR